jgi:redox-sensitive bicupin YhaK (pirin superfamily)
VDPVLQTVRLGAGPWPTLDPFLFCVHHVDAYPTGNGCFGPSVPLAGRELGMDFSGRDGWSMYHGRTVPGFPQHPHRGFETITVARRGLIDHADSLGAAARYGNGDAQWLTAGAGIVHAEMFPLLDVESPNPAELFQIWLNLPGVDKMSDPHFSMLWKGEIPVVADGGTTITVVAGAFGDRVPPPPPPSSWASRPDTDVAVWHLVLDPGAEADLPAAAGGDTTGRVLYVARGPVRLAGRELPGATAAVVDPRRRLTVTAGAAGAEILVLQGRPIGEPVAQHGPFVMNDRAGIEQAFRDYQRTGFGGWPWPADDPVHGEARNRFARHADGRLEPAPVPA